MWIELKISYIHEKTAIKMVNVRDFKRFRFRLRDQWCGPITSYLHLYIANKYCAIKWLMHGKRSLSYTARIFSSNSPKR